MNDKFKQTFGELINKLEPFLKKVKEFVASHKILTAVVTAVLVLVVAVAAFIADKLNRINYDDGSNPSVVYTAESSTMPSTSSKYTSYRAPDGSLVFSDGSYTNTAGAAILRDGTTIYPTGIVVFQDGSYIIGSGIRVSSDGIATFADSSKLHLTLFSIRKDGRILYNSPDGAISIINNVANNAVINSADGSSQLGITTTAPSISNNPGSIENSSPEYDDEDFDNVLQDIYNGNDSAAIEDLQHNDQLIEQNKHNNEIWYSDDVINILLMGIDQGGKNYPYGRSDAMIVASINKNTKSIRLISFARAAYVAIEGYANSRLNHAHGYGGPQLAIDTIEKNYKIRIDNYISTTFEAFQQLIDCLGGVEIGLSQAEIEDETMQYVLKKQGYENLVAGVYNLDGYSALNYVRLRSIDTDRERTQRQRNVLTALAAKANNMNIFELNSTLNEILPYVTTDLSKSEILSQMVNVPSYLSGNIEQYILPHKSSALQLIDGFDVVLIDWENEIAYTHELFYAGTDVKYITG